MSAVRHVGQFLPYGATRSPQSVQAERGSLVLTSTGTHTHSANAGGRTVCGRIATTVLTFTDSPTCERCASHQVKVAS